MTAMIPWILLNKNMTALGLQVDQVRLESAQHKAFIEVLKKMNIMALMTRMMMMIMITVERIKNVTM